MYCQLIDLYHDFMKPFVEFITLSFDPLFGYIQHCHNVTGFNDLMDTEIINVENLIGNLLEY